MTYTNTISKIVLNGAKDTHINSASDALTVITAYSGPCCLLFKNKMEYL